MSLSEKQRLFTECVGDLIRFAYESGYALTFGDAYRDEKVHGKWGEKKSYSAGKSCHKVRLAVDFNLFVDGVYIIDGAHPVWKILGEYWESLDDNARHGGRFDDSNHFSFLYKGVM